jgi:hypothetical protein
LLLSDAMSKQFYPIQSSRGRGGRKRGFSDAYHQAPPKATAGPPPPKTPRFASPAEEAAEQRVDEFLALDNKIPSASWSWRVGALSALRIQNAPDSDSLKKRLKIEERLATVELAAILQRAILEHALATQATLTELRALRAKRAMALGREAVKPSAAVISIDVDTSTALAPAPGD